MRLKRCEPNEVLQYWIETHGWIASALNHGGVFLTPENVWAALLNGQMTLWLALEGETVRACAVTQIIQYPKIKVSNWIVVGGRKMEDWFHLREEIEAHAKAQGCEAMESVSRPGMVKIIREYGYRPLVSIMRKAL